MNGVSLANPPGFSRPAMATLERLDVKLALIPLLSRQIEIDQLVLVKPDIMLETNAQGTAELAVRAADQSERAAARRCCLAEERVERSAWPMCGSRTAPLRGGTMSPGATRCLGSPALRATAASPDC